MVDFFRLRTQGVLSLSSLWSRLAGGKLTASRAAWSVAMGIAIGVTPLWGLHLPIVLALCLPLHADARVAFLASNISLPFVAPFLTMGEIALGMWLRTGHLLPVALPLLRIAVGRIAVPVSVGDF